MIILDTNVISEMMRRKADPNVIGWINQQNPETVWTTSVSIFEVCHGIEVQLDPVQKQNLRAAFEIARKSVFKGRILPFDALSAEEAAMIASRRRSAGLASEIRDLEIAGIASARHATLATRNVKDFSETGIALINPWDFQPG